MFIVTGLPRSRTAWASFFFSRAGLCLHEAIGLCSDIEELPDLLASRGAIGFSDPMVPWFAKPLKEMFPQAPSAVLARDIDSAVPAARRALPQMGAVDEAPVTQFFVASWQRIMKLNAKMFDFADPDLPGLWAHCLPEYPIASDDWWFTYADSFRVERDVEKQGRLKMDIENLWKGAA